MADVRRAAERSEVTTTNLSLISNNNKIAKWEAISPLSFFAATPSAAVRSEKPYISLFLVFFTNNEHQQGFAPLYRGVANAHPLLTFL